MDQLELPTWSLEFALGCGAGVGGAVREFVSFILSSIWGKKFCCDRSTKQSFQLFDGFKLHSFLKFYSFQRLPSTFPK